MENARLRASIVVGNNADEYVTREKEKTAYLCLLESEMKNGHERLDILKQNIDHLKFLRAALFSRFPTTSQNE